MIEAFSDYRAYLKDLFEKKAQRNPRFSLRAFAKLLGMSPSHLSRVLMGKKSLSTDLARQMGSALGLNDNQISHLADMVAFENAPNQKVKAMYLERIEKRTRKSKNKVIELDRFRVIADWEHFAILNLLRTKNFISSDLWISRRLALPLATVKAALQRLSDVGLIKKNGRYRLTEGSAELSTSDDVSSSAIRRHHGQVLKKAIDSLEHDPLELREFESLMIVFDPAQMAKAKSLIREFVARVNDELEAERGNDVYQLSLQFFPLTEQRTVQRSQQKSAQNGVHK